jgi:hypothetical protein
VIDGGALCREFEIVVDEFPEQAWDEAERQLLQRSQVGQDELPSLGWIPGELFGFEIAWEHDLQQFVDRFAL